MKPVFFQHAAPALFLSEKRRYPIEFPYAWTENDEISIAIPKGFALENRVVPGSLELGKPGAYAIEIFNRGGREIICHRRLVFGKDGSIAFPADAYPTLKHAFEEIHSRDEMVLSLMQTGAPGRQ